MEILRVEDTLYVVDEGVPIARVEKLWTIDYGDFIVAVAEGDDMMCYFGISRGGNRDFFEVYTVVEKRLAYIAA